MTVRKYGLRAERLYEKIKQDIMESDLFKFDWFIRTRSIHELSKRVTTLLTLITREFDNPDARKKRSRPGTKEDMDGLDEGTENPDHMEKKPKLPSSA